MMNQDEFLSCLAQLEMAAMRKNCFKVIADLGGQCFKDWINAEEEYKDIKKNLIKIARGES